jgi:hypothetical protein
MKVKTIYKIKGASRVPLEYRIIDSSGMEIAGETFLYLQDAKKRAKQLSKREKKSKIIFA